MKTQKNSGGARPGAGRKKGSTTVDAASAALSKSVTLPGYVWKRVEERCEKSGLSRAEYFRALVEKDADLVDTASVRIEMPCKEKQPLYKKYSDENFPQPAFVSLDCEAGLLSAGYNPECDYGVPGDVYLEKVLRWNISPYITFYDLYTFLQELLPLAEKVIAGYETRVVGSQKRGTFDADAMEAREAIDKMCWEKNEDAEKIVL